MTHIFLPNTKILKKKDLHNNFIQQKFYLSYKSRTSDTCMYIKYILLF